MTFSDETRKCREQAPRMDDTMHRKWILTANICCQQYNGRDTPRNKVNYVSIRLNGLNKISI